MKQNRGQEWPIETKKKSWIKVYLLEDLDGLLLFAVNKKPPRRLWNPDEQNLS